jgi:hypothetical protein
MIFFEGFLTSQYHFLSFDEFNQNLLVVPHEWK